jgi:DNA-binding IclR family transcriptional regulator
MSGVLERTLGLLELLSEQGQGVELAVLAERLNMPKSAAHRLFGRLGALRLCASNPRAR